MGGVSDWKDSYLRFVIKVLEIRLNTDQAWIRSDVAGIVVKRLGFSICPSGKRRLKIGTIHKHSLNASLESWLSTTTIQHTTSNRQPVMANRTSINCGSLESRTSFPKYIASIRNATADNFTLVSQCRAEICNALWGSGNPDISGVGVRTQPSFVEQNSADDDVTT